MWLKMKVSGVSVALRVQAYSPSSTANWDVNWCELDIALCSPPWLDYNRDNDEILLCSEIEGLAENLDKVLRDELQENEVMDCIEPDFRFIFHPNIGRFLDAVLLWEIFFWQDGCITDNWLTLGLDREAAQNLRDYLFLVTGKLSLQSPAIQLLVGKGQLCQ